MKNTLQYSIVTSAIFGLLSVAAYAADQDTTNGTAPAPVAPAAIAPVAGAPAPVAQAPDAQEPIAQTPVVQNPAVQADTNVGVQAQAAGVKTRSSAKASVAVKGSPDSAEAATLKLTAVDEKFLRQASNTNLLEIKLGTLAQTKAESASVKAFAETMIKDHGQAQASLEKVAARNSVTLSQNVDAEGQKELDKLSALSGRAFDNAYMEFNIHAHSKTLADMKHKVNVVRNVDLKTWDTNTIPVVEHHLSMASQTNKDLASAQIHESAGIRKHN